MSDAKAAHDKWLPYWKNRVGKQGKDYVSRGAKNTDSQTTKIYELILEQLKHSKFLHGLDYGCGWGRFTSLLSTFCDKIMGVDILDDFEADVRTPNVEFAQISYPVHIPVPDSTFDFFWSCLVFQHIVDEALFNEVTEEIRRVLRPDAFVLLIDDATPTSASHVKVRGPGAIAKALGLSVKKHEKVQIDDPPNKHWLLQGITQDASS